MSWPTTTRFRATRIGDAPIIHPDMPGLEDGVGANINGPSLIKMPGWLPNRLGKYYLYFAHHQGKFVRLACADRIEGPYKIHKPGTVSVNDVASAFGERDAVTGEPSDGRPPDHVASPDVHVDEERREIRMYFHAAKKGWPGQFSFRARSDDGLAFGVHAQPLGVPYFRVFAYGGAYYAIAKLNGNRGIVLYRSPDGIDNFEEGPSFMPDCRHTALWREGDTLHVFHSNYRQLERILVSTIDLTKPWTEWRLENTELLLAPERDYEGANLPEEPSKPGAIHEPANQLRDPAIYEENGQLAMLYSVAGESGIALARIERIGD